MAVFLIRCDQLWPPIMYLKTYLDLWLSFICIFIKCSGPKSVFLGHNHSRMAQKELSSFPLRSTVDTYSWPRAWGPLSPSSDHVTSSTVSIAPTCSWAFPAGGLWWEGGVPSSCVECHALPSQTPLGWQHLILPPVLRIVFLRSPTPGLHQASEFCLPQPCCPGF